MQGVKRQNRRKLKSLRGIRQDQSDFHYQPNVLCLLREYPEFSSHVGHQSVTNMCGSTLKLIVTRGKMIDPFQEPVTFTKREVEFRGNLETYFQASPGSNVEKLENFAKYVPRQNLTSFLAQYELFKKVLYVQGSIIECGVYLGGSLMTFAHLSSILEPVNFQRQIIGFDTFSGYPTLSDKDNSEASVDTRVGPLAVDSHEDLMRCIELYDANRFISHIPKVSLVKGDILHTLPKYLEEHRHNGSQSPLFRCWSV